MRAQYPSYCETCGGPIDQGDEIVAHRNGWAHRSCRERE